MSRRSFEVIFPTFNPEVLGMNPRQVHTKVRIVANNSLLHSRRRTTCNLCGCWANEAALILVFHAMAYQKRVIGPT